MPASDGESCASADSEGRIHQEGLERTCPDDRLTVEAQTNAPGAFLRRGDALPFFDVVTVDGSHVACTQFWQHRNVVLVSLWSGRHEPERELLRTLASRSGDVDALQAICVVTCDAVTGVPRPGVVIADGRGEVQSVAAGCRNCRLFDTLERGADPTWPECSAERGAALRMAVDGRGDARSSSCCWGTGLIRTAASIRRTAPRWRHRRR